MSNVTTWNNSKCNFRFKYHEKLSYFS